MVRLKLLIGWGSQKWNTQGKKSSHLRFSLVWCLYGVWENANSEYFLRSKTHWYKPQSPTEWHAYSAFFLVISLPSLESRAFCNNYCTFFMWTKYSPTTITEHNWKADNNENSSNNNNNSNPSVCQHPLPHCWTSSHLLWCSARISPWTSSLWYFSASPSIVTEKHSLLHHSHAEDSQL